MRARQFITEALKPSEYRPLVKGWNRQRFAQLFSDPKFKTDKNHYRVYLPLENPSIHSSTIVIPWEIRADIDKKGYEIIDYVDGLAKEIDGKRVMKIGKLLSTPELQAMFANDRQRQARGKYMVVISRHPYDIAGMSTNRGWHSCMNLHTGINKHYVPIDVKDGTIVAYVINKNDLDIKNPVGRIAIKPFIEIYSQEIVFGAEDKIYGAPAPGFKETVKMWTDYTNSKIITSDMILARVSPRVYHDSDVTRNAMIFDPSLKQIYDDPSLLFKIENPTERQQLVAVSSYSGAIEHIRNPTERAQLLAVKNNGHHIYYINNPSEDVQLAAVSEYGNAIKWIKHPSEEVQRAAVDNSGSAIQYIENPSEELQLIAINRSVSSIEHIKNPSEKVKQIAVTHDYNAIRLFSDPSEELQLIAVTKNPRMIEYIENPSERVQLAAVNGKGNLIQFIKDPSERVQLAAVKTNPFSILDIEHPTKRVMISAIKHNPWVITLIDEELITPAMLKLADKIKEIRKNEGE